MPYSKRRIVTTFARRVRRRRGRGFKKRTATGRGKWREFGNPVGTRTNRAQLVLNDVHVANMRSLQVDSLTTLQRNSTGTEDINERSRNIANIRGWRVYIRLTTQNTGATSMVEPSAPVMVHLAVVYPRRDPATPAANNFFRDYTKDTRSLDFSNVLRHSQYNYPLNPDKWRIIKHKRYLLNQPSDPLQAGSRPSTRDIKWWIPCRRQLEYRNTASLSEDECYVIMWADTVNSDGTAEVGQVKYDIEAHCFFKNSDG